ncbi:MAG: methylmalonyl Co-A mutase-associated GTPase MeaB [Myxococcales bacterium]|nr:methylmalonyl Co-A mutase-associated GTPase MeaB [Myxococcales bacterium]
MNGASHAFDVAGLAGRLTSGEPLALARGISHVENETEGFEALLHAVHAKLGRARRIGITGPPGAGKSTLTAELARRYLDTGLTVGVIAVDPTSPFTGGALLGDRIRMNELATEEGIFIRSMASRGSLGGLATATREAADLMDAAGYDRVILETLGVGQSELDIAASADTTAVVLVPESGDGIQAMKAGLMEVADLFVVNKADRSGADRLEKEIRVMIAIREGNAIKDIASHHGARVDRPTEVETGDRSPPVLQTTASTGDGVDELSVALDEHFEWLEATGELASRRAERRLRRTQDVLMRLAQRDALGVWSQGSEDLGERLAANEVSPYSAARELYESWIGSLLRR